jgi:ubiquinone/menaquinone biosynthesis C-methylase UbiE
MHAPNARAARCQAARSNWAYEAFSTPRFRLVLSRLPRLLACTSVNSLVRFAFRQFYTRFAWTYDTVARAVSFGEWREWGRAALGFLPQTPGARILEIGHGPGHLQVLLRQRGLPAIGIDLSPQMGRMAQRNLLRAGVSQPNLARASALQLPFPAAQFDAVLSTFPAEFIFVPETLQAIARVLRADGRLVIVPTAGFRARGLLTRMIDAAYRLSGQRAALAAVEAQATQRLAAAGLGFESARVQTQRADVVVWVCQRV